jgi:hypothetical protein
MESTFPPEQMGLPEKKPQGRPGPGMFGYLTIKQ